MPLLRGAKDLAQFIGKNYSGRVVEIGAGHVLEVALHLASMGRDVMVTDKEERNLGGLHVEKDDIFMPRLDLYREASLLYSIRPPSGATTGHGHPSIQAWCRYLDSATQ